MITPGQKRQDLTNNDVNTVNKHLRPPEIWDKSHHRRLGLSTKHWNYTPPAALRTFLTTRDLLGFTRDEGVAGSGGGAGLGEPICTELSSSSSESLVVLSSPSDCASRVRFSSSSKTI